MRLLIAVIAMASLILACIGPAGPAGPQGPQGEPGLEGEQGERGAVGREAPQGPQGDQGVRGDQGPKGDAGVGVAGEKGEKGDAGPKGDKGDRGSKGDRGDRGAQGPQGEKGETGGPGPQGEPGPVGEQGPKVEVPVDLYAIDISSIEPHTGEVYRPSNVRPVDGPSMDACSGYDTAVSWLEKAYVEFSICYTAEHSEDVEFAAYWAAYARDIQRVKYGVEEFVNRVGRPLHVNVMLLPEPDVNADVGTTRFMCCYTQDGELAYNGEFAWIPYLTPSHSDWQAYPSLGQLRFRHDDAHAKNIIHEMTHAGQHVICDYSCQQRKGHPDMGL